MKKKVLILVKTYPAISTKYGETVCTAGITEEGEWIRIYPIPFRKIDFNKRYSKYDWIELELTKNSKDFRPESFRPLDPNQIVKLGHIDSDKDTWRERRSFVLKNVYTNMSKLIEDAKDKEKCTSLAVFKPTKILDFTYEKTESFWDPKKIKALESEHSQGSLFETNDLDDITEFEVVDKVPYKFKFRFQDETGKESNLMIEDWETGMLYWNSLKKHEGDTIKACEDVFKKYFEDFAKTKDYYFILGTTLKHHYLSKNPFVIIGDFRPKPIKQPGLFGT
ncbi:hypothetical protein EHQ94_07075 [Leptospira meyeri]|uniref:hypothetical protein n=1 Tax=Leptospira meyeri TaxID=29508 RepID=UPI0010841BA9|nr:hypothetical protein [Leptospira meyeri]TGM63185.1 hypothetical protein EHQ93_08980 [Leptospira meyeri]TGM70286.1 hypothetical protein EHQ94_07075 [Leptospira meyeri]